MGQDTSIREARLPADLETVRCLFEEYAASLGFDLAFQDFESELESLPGAYSPPSGRLWLAEVGLDLAGCAALRSLGEGFGEMKRFYVRPAYRGRGIGRRLSEACIAAARELGYERIRLDTVPGMTAAIGLYESLGFRDIAPYCPNPIAGARFMELNLRPREAAASRAS